MEPTDIESTGEEIVKISRRHGNSDPSELPNPKRIKDDQDIIFIPYTEYSHPISVKDITARMPVEIHAERYNMNNKYRGKCIVFTQRTNVKSEDRADTTVDDRRIRKTFEQLGFTVLTYSNLNLQSMMNILHQLSKEDHEDADCICIFIISHSTSENIFWADDKSYNTDEIWKPFTANRCKTLAGKPKLFFFHACRAEEEESEDEQPMSQDTITGKPYHDWNNNFYKIPTHADFLFVHCFPEGFYSQRHPKNGTFFVETLCEVLTKFANRADLLKMITITMLKIAKASGQKPNAAKQVPSITSMLLRDIYFSTTK